MLHIYIFLNPIKLAHFRVTNYSNLFVNERIFFSSEHRHLNTATFRQVLHRYVYDFYIDSVLAAATSYGGHCPSFSVKEKEGHVDRNVRATLCMYRNMPFK